MISKGKGHPKCLISFKTFIPLSRITTKKIVFKSLFSPKDNFNYRNKNIWGCVISIVFFVFPISLQYFNKTLKINQLFSPQMGDLFLLKSLNY